MLDDKANGNESHDDELPDDIKAILGIDTDQGSDDDKSKKKAEEKPDKSPKKFRTLDGKEFASLEEKEAYIDGRDKKADTKLRSAASLRRKSLEDGADDAPATTGKKLQKIDLTTIDLEEKPKDYAAAVLHNEKVRDQEVAELRRKMEDTEQSATDKETRKEMRDLARSEAKKRGLKLSADALDDFLDEAEKSTTTVESVNALMKLLDTAQKSATAKDDEEDKGKGKGDEEEEEGGSIRVPGGGQGGLNKQDVMMKATKKIEELQDGGKFDELPYETQVNLTRASVGLKPMKFPK